MNRISEIDRNFEIGSTLSHEGIKFYNCLDKPFCVYGVKKYDDRFRRMPKEVAKRVSEGVFALHDMTAGGRVRFKTDSKCVAISAKMENISKMSHFAFSGSAGFDLYADDIYIKSYIPPINLTDGYEGMHIFEDVKMRDITINFPLYSGVVDLHIGLDEDAQILEASAYVNDKPVVYYGSSITQGGCASRPGTSYQSIISRRFNCDYLNLGFAGNAKAEDEIIEYIKGLDMSLFVYDYDHNAPDTEHLQRTHEKMFKAIREEHKDIPIIMMSRPKNILDKSEIVRREIIEKTYNNALSTGDKNVYFIDGKKLTELCGNEGTVDNCHPTDFGFASMAKALGDVIEKNKLIQ